MSGLCAAMSFEVVTTNRYVAAVIRLTQSGVTLGA